ncbi:putative uroporphyrinogen III C-methyltransferase [Escherichia coli]|uniref:Putative uroporphyrinogen III C-methyltransferase n=1 Tax=Escherichia coli TaxID=562 RepID=A0A2X1JIV1_ECOLX|nr:putative uroporphyrinogen III C-methyltransferase [Escherichia coli]
MNDPSLITVRRAITDDIASLSAVSQVDYDGIILKLNQLSNQVDNLRLADNDSDGSPMDSDGEELSSSISEWRINLQKSWQNFMDNFITIRRRDDTAVPLLAPKSGYLSARKYSLSPAGRSTSCTASPGRDLSPGAGERLHLGYVLTTILMIATTKAFLDEVDQLSQQKYLDGSSGNPAKPGDAGKTDADSRA